MSDGIFPVSVHYRLLLPTMTALPTPRMQALLGDCQERLASWADPVYLSLNHDQAADGAQHLDLVYETTEPDDVSYLSGCVDLANFLRETFGGTLVDRTTGGSLDAETCARRLGIFTVSDHFDIGPHGEDRLHWSTRGLAKLGRYDLCLDVPAAKFGFYAGKLLELLVADVLTGLVPRPAMRVSVAGELLGFAESATTSDTMDDHRSYGRLAVVDVDSETGAIGRDAFETLREIAERTDPEGGGQVGWDAASFGE